MMFFIKKWNKLEPVVKLLICTFIFLLICFISEKREDKKSISYEEFIPEIGECRNKMEE